MVSIRSTFQFIAVALYAASTAQAIYIPTTEHSHAQRDIAPSDDVVVLSARDLTELGVRSEGISHVLVVRAPVSRTPTPDGFPKTKKDADEQIAYWKKQLTEAKAKAKQLTTDLRTAEKAKPPNAENIRKIKNQLDTAKGSRDGAQERIEDLTALKSSLP